MFHFDGMTWLFCFRKVYLHRLTDSHKFYDIVVWRFYNEIILNSEAILLIYALKFHRLMSFTWHDLMASNTIAQYWSSIYWYSLRNKKRDDSRHENNFGLEVEWGKRSDRPTKLWSNHQVMSHQVCYTPSQRWNGFLHQTTGQAEVTNFSKRPLHVLLSGTGRAAACL